MPNFKQSRGFKMKGFSGFKSSPAKMYGKKSPAKKELVGNQENLPEELKAKIEASPAKMYGKKSPVKQDKKKIPTPTTPSDTTSTTDKKKMSAMDHWNAKWGNQFKAEMEKYKKNPKSANLELISAARSELQKIITGQED